MVYNLLTAASAGGKSEVILSVATLVSFVAMVAVNALVSNGVGVNLTNAVISDAHPLYVTPKGWAFSIWGIIYLLVGTNTR